MSWLPQLVELVYARLGIIEQIESREVSVRRAVEERTKALGLGSPGKYVERLTLTSGDDDEFQNLVALVTNGHTYFFRDEVQIHSLREVLIARVSPKPFRVWCAACSTGEEPYSIAITAAAMGLPIQIVATDVNEVALESARRGVYDAWTMRRVPSDLVHYLPNVEGHVQVVHSIKRMVTFRHHNLMADPPRPEGGERWDAIFCRNVFIYFDDESITRVVRRMGTVLRADGLLFLGASERLPASARGWTTATVGGRIAYQRRAANGGEGEWPRADSSLPRTSPVSAQGVVPVAGPKSLAMPRVESPPRGVSALGRSRGGGRGSVGRDFGGQRRHMEASLSSSSTPSPRITRAATPSALVASNARVELNSARMLIEQGAFEKGLGALRALIERGADEPSIWTLRGAVSLETHDFDDALESCQEAIDIDPFMPEPYYFQGVTHRKLGNYELARAALQRAVFLSPGFWPAAFMLAGVWDRLGQSGRAVHEFAHVRSLIAEGVSTVGAGFPARLFPGGAEAAAACDAHLARAERRRG